MTRLFPGPPEDLPVAGSYLAHGLHREGSPEAPLVYADFVSSLDGRIALVEPGAKSAEGEVPEGLMSRSDFRLLVELQAQADCLVTHSGYLRAIAEGRLDDILQIGRMKGTEDLADWRREQGLAPQPAVAIASESLDFPLPPSLAAHGQRVLLFTGANAPERKVAAWESQGLEVIRAGQGDGVEGGPLTEALGERGFRSLFLLSGPRMLETMLRDRRLARLYITIAHRLLGGAEFRSLIEGPALGEAGELALASLYQEEGEEGGSLQWFTQFRPVRR
jgi:riboflavin biosynthesis pyrimidine reductase